MPDVSVPVVADPWYVEHVAGVPPGTAIKTADSLTHIAYKEGRYGKHCIFKVPCMKEGWLVGEFTTQAVTCLGCLGA